MRSAGSHVSMREIRSSASGSSRSCGLAGQAVRSQIKSLSVIAGTSAVMFCSAHTISLLVFLLRLGMLSYLRIAAYSFWVPGEREREPGVV